jgi:hypothetical protein
MTNQASTVASPVRIVALVIAAMAIPTVAFSIFIVITRHFESLASAFSDYVALALSIALGLLFVWQLPLSIGSRIVICFFGSIAMAVWLFFYGFAFVCTVYGDCL